MAEPKPKRKYVIKPTEAKILKELQEQTKVLLKIADLLDAQWRGRNPY